MVMTCGYDMVVPWIWSLFVCKIPLLARRTRPSARATIGYLVYKVIMVSGISLPFYYLEPRPICFVIIVVNKLMKKIEFTILCLSTVV